MWQGFCYEVIAKWAACNKHATGGWGSRLDSNRLTRPHDQAADPHKVGPARTARPHHFTQPQSLPAEPGYNAAPGNGLSPDPAIAPLPGADRLWDGTGTCRAADSQLAKNLPKTNRASSIAPDLQTRVLDLQALRDGRGWDRTSDLPRVKRALSR